MAVIETWFKQDLKSMVAVHPLPGNVFTADNDGNLVGVEVFDDGVPADLAGTVSANIIRPDGGTVSVGGTLADGNRCSVILPQAAYAYPGQVAVIIKLTNGTTVTTIGAAVGFCARSTTGVVVDPGTIIPSVQNLIDEIEAAIADVPASATNLRAALAETYSTSGKYAIGSYAWQEGELYKCIVPINSGETWNPSHWTKAKLASDVYDLKSATDAIEDAVSEDEPPQWEKGTINASNGINGPSTTRIRSVSAIDITTNIVITVPAGAFVGLRPYKADDSFYAYGSTKFTGTFNLYDSIKTWLSTRPSVTKMRFIAGYLDDRTISSVDDLTITVVNPVMISSAELKETLENIIDAGLTESTKAAQASAVGTVIYGSKNRTSNFPGRITFWRPASDGYGTENKFSPLDMPINTYTVVSGNSMTDDFVPLNEVKGDNYVYWIYSLVSLYNTNLRIYIVISNATGSIYYGYTSSASTQPVMRFIGGENSPKIMFFGDSIIRGINSDTSPSQWSNVNIPNLLRKELKCVVDNYAIGSIGWLETGGSSKGTALDYLKRVGDSDWYWDETGSYVNNKFINKAVKTWSDYNTIILSFGGNDRAVGGVATTLGSLDDIDDTMSYADVMAMTPTTIVEAMYQCYRYIREQAPTINIILSDPLMQVGGTAPWWSYPTRYSPSKWSWNELNEMYANFAKRYGLGHMSHYDAPINRVDPTISLADNVHPTTACMYQLARHFAGKISALVL